VKRFRRSTWMSIVNLKNCVFLETCDLSEISLDEIKIDATDKPREGIILSQSVWGILRGLESFSQLIYASQNGIAVSRRKISI